jgi:hypothetical protein
VAASWPTRLANAEKNWRTADASKPVAGIDPGGA